MNWDFILLFLFANFICLQAWRSDGVNRVIQNLKRRHSNRNAMFSIPQRKKDLPRAERILPGHSLIRPARGMLKSAVKYPLRDLSTALVYGNLDNLGITYGKTPHRLLYSGFRRSNDIMELTLLQAIHNIIKYEEDRNSNTDVIVIESKPPKEKSALGLVKQKFDVAETNLEDENNAGELLDSVESSSSEEDNEGLNYRRSKKRKKRDSRSKEKKKDKGSSSKPTSSSSSESSEKSEFDKNPGNPYTLHRGKYKQNWMWNHFMDGDHMNINPYGPAFPAHGPNGPDLFFGRKWWYFHQDDYRPMRR